MRKTFHGLLILSAVPCWFALALPGQGPAPVPANDKIDFVKDVAPIFIARCIECHGAKDPEADLRLDVKAGLFHDIKEDWTVVPGKAKESALYERIILPADDEEIMPAEGKPLTKAQVDVIRRWIDAGAIWPDGADAQVAALIAGGKPKQVQLDLPELSAAAKAAEDKAMAAIEAAGGLAMRVAANTSAAEVNLSLLGQKATNAVVALTADLTGSLVRLNLARTKIDDAALAVVGNHKHLRWLNLSNTAVTDAGLEKLAGLAQLRYLNLYGTPVTDAGLEKLQVLKSLEKLYLWQTKATKAGARTLQAAVPKLRIDMGEYAEILAKIKPVPVKPAANQAAVAINQTCPVSGKAVVAGHVAEFQGQVIGFCCGKCKASFDRDPAKFIGKVAEFEKAKAAAAKAAGKGAANQAGVAINQTCPVSGEPVAAGKVSEFQGQVIGFCCGKCKASFDRDPAKFIGKVAEFEKAKAAAGKAAGKAAEKPAGKGAEKQAAVAINQTCPVSGEPVAAGKVSEFQGQVIGFCCGKCKASFDRDPAKFIGKVAEFVPPKKKGAGKPK